MIKNCNYIAYSRIHNVIRFRFNEMISLKWGSKESYIPASEHLSLNLLSICNKRHVQNKRHDWPNGPK